MTLTGFATTAIRREETGLRRPTKSHDPRARFSAAAAARLLFSDAAALAARL